jgi:hypothetical protein
MATIDEETRNTSQKSPMMIIIIEKLQRPRCCDEVVQWIQNWLSHKYVLEKRKDSMILARHQKSPAILREGPVVRFSIPRSNPLRGMHLCLTTINRATGLIALGTTWAGSMNKSDLSAAV